MRRSRSNPLALAVLVTLMERPRHPYDVASTLRQRVKERSVRLNYGSLYAVVESLHKRGLIEPKEVVREGRLPERTVYQVTDAGRVEATDWLADLVAEPTREFPQFGAALALLAALPPDEVVDLLKQRLRALSMAQAEAGATRELVQKHGLPRLLWIDDEYRERILETEIDYVRTLVSDIESGNLDGIEWWRHSHTHGFGQVPPPFDPDGLAGS